MLALLKTVIVYLLFDFGKTLLEIWVADLAAVDSFSWLDSNERSEIRSPLFELVE